MHLLHPFWLLFCAALIGSMPSAASAQDLKQVIDRVAAIYAVERLRAAETMRPNIGHSYRGYFILKPVDLLLRLLTYTSRTL